MKQFIWVAAILFSGLTATAAFIPGIEKQEEANTVQVLEKNTFSKTNVVTAAAYEKLTGKKMGLFKRWAFKAAQRQAMKKGIFDKEELTEGFHVGAFLIGFFTLGIGYLICLFVAKDSNFTKWCGIGTAAAFAIASVVFLSLGYR